MKTPSRSRPARFDDLSEWSYRIRVKLNTLWILASYPFAAKGRGISIHLDCQIARRSAHQISLGNDVYLYQGVWLNVLPNDDRSPRITIGDNCTIGARNKITAKNSIHIGRGVISAENVLLQDHLHAFENPDLPIRDQGATSGGRIRIEQGCWLGQGAAIICNEGELVIGRNSVIGVNAVVTRSIPPYSVVSGNPARVVKQYDPEKKSWVLGSVRTTETMVTV
jgi:acetyltransferase-like isoleucine patch superfamily enzyme